MNIGVDAATGTFLARISVGDRFVPGKLAAQKTEMVERQLDVVGANVQVIDGAGNPVGEKRVCFRSPAKSSAATSSTALPSFQARR